MEAQTNPFEEALTINDNNAKLDDTENSIMSKQFLCRKPRNYAEKLLDILSWFFLVLGLIALVGCIVAWFVTDGDFPPKIILFAFIGCLVGLFKFAFFQVFRNISIKLDK